LCNDVDTEVVMSMLSARIYMDYNATAPMTIAARERMIEVLHVWGNPSSLHADGRSARTVVETARDQVADLLGCDRFRVLFTSGGTESDHLGVMALARAAELAGLPNVALRTAIDHPALIGAVEHLLTRGWTVKQVAVNQAGQIDVNQLSELISGGVGLVALSAVNHELGVLAPIAEVAEMLSRHGGYLHVDAVQAAGRIAMGELTSGAHSVAISAHKVGGSKGVGALALRGDRYVDQALPLIASGHQERERRPGTENVHGIAAFGAAAEHAAAMQAQWGRVAALGEQFEQRLLAMSAVINGAGAPRIGGTVNAAFAGARGDSIAMALDIAGVSVSTGAACTSGSIKPSAVLLGLGQSELQARSAIRFSLGHASTDDEVVRVCSMLPDILHRARR
jgi:cysteine desulfurase